MAGKPKRKYRMTFRAGGLEHCMDYSSRALRILGDDHFQEGGDFQEAVGLFENRTVLDGRNTDAWSSKSVATLHKATKRLLKAILRDQDLLSYNYLYSFPEEPSPNGKVPLHGGGMGISIDGESGLLWAKLPGSLYILFSKLNKSGQAESYAKIDLRTVSLIQTDSRGLLKVHRRKCEFELPGCLTALSQFLGEVRSSKIEIRHHFSNE